MAAVAFNDLGDSAEPRSGGSWEEERGAVGSNGTGTGYG
jgi:hypothetical protein